MVTNAERETIARLKRYLQATLGIDADPVPWRGQDQVPLFLTDRYRFFDAGVDGQRWLLVLDLIGEGEPPSAVRKHLDMVETRWTGTAIYVRERITADRRQRLVAQRVPFVVPDNQLYLPMIGADFRERFRQERAERSALSPATQALFVLTLLDDREDWTPTAAAERIGYTSMTISRAMTELETVGLARSRSEGRARCLQLVGTRREAWQRAQDLLRSPVASEFAVPVSALSGLPAPTAGLTALSRYTMLAAPACPVVAVARSAWKETSVDMPRLDAMRGEPDTATIQVWSYDPELFASGGRVDRLSLFLALRDDADERVQSALADMLEELSW